MHFRKQKALCLGLILSLFLVCPVTLLAETVPSETAAKQPVTIPQGALRLAWESRESFHPLNTFDASGRAILPLVYRGLFQIDDQERLQTDLAAEASWSVDHLALSVRLRRDESFSDRSPLTARDAALSILYYRSYLAAYLKSQSGAEMNLPPDPTEEGEEVAPDPWSTTLDFPPPLDCLTQEAVPEPTTPENSADEDLEGTENPEGVEDPEAATVGPTVFTADAQEEYLDSLGSEPWGIDSLAAIDHINLEADDRFTIYLSQVAERLPWYLTMPIIPEAYMSLDNDVAAPGIGSYTMTMGDGVTVLHALLSGQEQANLALLSYQQWSDALYAFSEGKLDVLFVPPGNFENLALRQDLHVISQESLTYRFLLAGSDPDYILAHFQERRAFRQGLRLNPANTPLQPNLPWVLRQGDWRRHYLPEEVYAAQDLEVWQECKALLKESRLTLAALANGRNREIVRQLEEYFYSLVAEVETIWLTPEEYSDFAAQGRYDFLLCEQDLNLPCDFRTLHDELRKWGQGLYQNLPTLSEEALLLPNYAYGWDLDSSDRPEAVLPGYYQKLSESFAESPVFAIGFTEQGLLLGSRLKNLKKSPAWDPYRYIGEASLWD